MARASRADFFVGRVRRESARITDRRRDHARHLPELAPDTPETAHPEPGFFESRRSGLLDVRAVHEMFAADRQRCVAAGKRLVLRGNGRLLAEEGHRGLLWMRGMRKSGVDSGITQDRARRRFITAKLAPPMTESASTPRLRATFAIYLGLVAATAVVGPAETGAAAYYATGVAGFLLVALACLGRLWCSVFIAGHKDESLVTTG